MADRQGRLSFIRKSHPQHIVAAVAAVCVSGILHVLLIQHCPSFSLGSPGDLALLKRVHSVVLDRVLPEYAPENAVLDAFRPKREDQLTDTLLYEQMVLDPALPQIERGVLYNDDAGLHFAEDTAGPLESWDARPHILEVEDRKYADEISALPRRFTPEVRRTYSADDVLPPLVYEAPDAIPIDLAGRYGDFPDYLMKMSGNNGDAWKSGFFPRGGSELMGVSDLLNEPDKEISDFKPVEDLLGLELLTYRPKDEDYLYFRIGIHQKTEDGLPVLAKNTVFIQDCSESMTVEKLEECKTALIRAVDKLSTGDKFNIVGFRDESYSCYTGSTNVTPLTRARARWFINDMQSRGNTDVYTPLKNIRQEADEEGGPIMAILLTDGRPTAGLIDTSEILDQFAYINNGLVSVFTVGGGRKVNKMLLDFLSYKNRGDAYVVNDQRDIPEAVVNLMDEISRPVMVSLDYNCTPLDEQDLYPDSLTHLYLDRPLVLHGRCSASTDEVLLQITGQSVDGLYDMVFPLTWESAASGDEALRVQWVWHRIYDLMSQFIRGHNPQILAELQKFADQYGLVIPYSSALGINEKK